MYYSITDEEVRVINEVARKLFMNNVTAGWWSDEKGVSTVGKATGHKYALMHSELSEAYEGWRKDLMDTHLPERKNEEVEMADAMIRILDYCASERFNIGEAIQAKTAYNTTRLDHKAEARADKHGKKT